MDKLLIIIGVVLLAIILIPLVIMWGWAWFMVPVYGMKTLAFSEAFGLFLLGACVRSGTKSNT